MEMRPAILPRAGAEGSEDAYDSVTDLGDPALVRAPSVQIERGTVLAGRYQVEAVIGKGGSGIVLRVFDRVAEVAVALKILKPELAIDPRWLDRFSRELRLARQIQHVNVCRVFDIDEADGHRFLTMELATEGTLREALASGAEARPVDERLADARAAISGLAAIHASGIVHRDVKPDNFLRMADRRLVLSDFGLATNCLESPAMTIMVGTPSYMAPEVLLGEPATAMSDVWSLGIVLHELAFGARPAWDASATGRTLRVPAAARQTAFHRAIATVCADCLSEDPSLRPVDAADVARRFELALAGKRYARPRTARRSKTLWLWPAVAALVGLGYLGTRSNHLWSSAGATSIAEKRGRAITRAAGAAQDWSTVSRVVGSFRETVHCLAWRDHEATLELVIGSPRRAVNIDVATGQMRPSTLPREMFAYGCPQRSGRDEVLFERPSAGGNHEIVLAPSSEMVDGARVVTSGTEPLWLPNGTEFVLNVDGGHAAVFSLPLMTSNLIVDDLAEANFLVEKSISNDGQFVALRYMDQLEKKHLIVHRLPSLTIAHSVTMQPQASRVAFWGGEGQLLVDLEELDGATLSLLDLNAGTLTRAGRISGRLLRQPTTRGDSLAFKAIQPHSEVWRYQDGKLVSKVLDEGVNFNPDLSEQGDMIVERLNSDGRSVIRLFPVHGAPRDLTSGPNDHTPQFLPDGTGWLYVDGDRRAIKRCNPSGCQTVYAAADYPFFPVASPDQRRVAYVTKIGRPRLMVLDVGGKARDVGPARSDCSPRWSSNDSIWVIQGSERSPLWKELDVTTGRETGARADSGAARDETFACPFLLDPPRALHQPRVATRSWEEVDVRVLRTD